MTVELLHFSKNRNAWSFPVVPRTQHKNEIWFFAMQLKNWQTPRNLMMLYLTWKQYDYYIFVGFQHKSKNHIPKLIIPVAIYFYDYLTYHSIYVFISVRLLSLNWTKKQPSAAVTTGSRWAHAYMRRRILGTTVNGKKPNWR